MKEARRRRSASRAQELQITALPSTVNSESLRRDAEEEAPITLTPRPAHQALRARYEQKPARPSRGRSGWPPDVVWEAGLLVKDGHWRRPVGGEGPEGRW